MHKLPGVETNTGALGYGLSISGGMAVGLKMAGAVGAICDFEDKEYAESN